MDFNLILMEFFSQQLENLIKHLDCRLDFYYSVILNENDYPFIEKLKENTLMPYPCSRYYADNRFDIKLWNSVHVKQIKIYGMV